MKSFTLSLALKKIYYFLIFLLLLTGISYSQNVQKVIEFNCDTNTTVSGLPYNQDLIFKIKCKSIPLQSISHVLLLQNKGKRSGPQSIEYYSKKNKLDEMTYYQLNKEFFTNDSSLKVFLAQDRYYYTISWLKRSFSNVPKNRLLPSKSYTLYLITDEIDEQSQEIISLVKQIVDIESSPSGSGAANQRVSLSDKFAVWKLKMDSLYGFIPIRPGVISPDDLIVRYRDSISGLDHIISNRLDTLNNRIDSIRGIQPSIDSNDIRFIFRLISLLRDTSNLCFKNYRCFDTNCSLIQALTGLSKLKESKSFNVIASAKGSLIDIQYPSFKVISEEKIEERIRKRNLTLSQLNVIKGFIQNLIGLTYDSCFQKRSKDCFCGNISFKERVDSLNKHVSSFETNYLSIEQYLNNYFEGIQNRSKAIERTIFSKTTIRGKFAADTYVYNFDTRTKQSIIPVFGYALVGFQKGFTTFTPYTGVNLSLQPLDENIPFNLLRNKTIWQRLNFTIGFSLASIKEEGKRDDLFANKSNLLAGVGFKLSHVVSLNVGAIAFRKEDPNPFITTKKVAATLYAGLSINLKVQALLEGFKNLIPAK